MQMMFSLSTGARSIAGAREGGGISTVEIGNERNRTSYRRVSAAGNQAQVIRIRWDRTDWGPALSATDQQREPNLPLLPTAWPGAR